MYVYILALPCTLLGAGQLLYVTTWYIERHTVTWPFLKLDLNSYRGWQTVYLLSYWLYIEAKMCVRPWPLVCSKN